MISFFQRSTHGYPHELKFQSSNVIKINKETRDFVVLIDLVARACITFKHAVTCFLCLVEEGATY
jgi:hypothetical protein